MNAKSAARAQLVVFVVAAVGEADEWSIVVVVVVFAIAVATRAPRAR